MDFHLSSVARLRPSNLDVECDVEVGCRMRDPARRGVIDAGARDLGDVVQRDAARSLERESSRNQIHRVAQGVRVHVVEQHRVGDPDRDDLAQLIERIDLDLDLDEMAGGGLRAFEHGPDAAGDRDVIVLDQDRVIETKSVIEAAAATHRIFL